MHQYIKYLFIILGSLSIAHGCQNTNNNNHPQRSFSDKRVYCLCCPINELFTTGRGGLPKGLFKNYHGFLMHFYRHHNQEHKVPSTKKEAFIIENFMRTIQETSTTEEVLKEIRSELQKKQNTKNASTLAIPTSPLAIPIGSPTLSQHDKTDIMSDSETESKKDLGARKISHASKKVISVRKNKKPVTTSNSYSSPSTKGNPQFFLEDEFDIQTTETKRLKLASTDVTQGINTHPSEQCNNFIFWGRKELVALAVLKNWPEIRK